MILSPDHMIGMSNLQSINVLVDKIYWLTLTTVCSILRAGPVPWTAGDQGADATVRHSLSESEAILQDLGVELSKERMVLAPGGQEKL